MSAESDASSATIRGLLRAMMDDAAAKVALGQRYWYPLSRPTYDVEEVEGALESMCGFATSMGEKTARFESRFGSKFGFDECIMVNSGSSADLLIAFALVNPAVRRLAAGDEVLVPAVTWPTQLWSLLMAGLSPRVVDIDPQTLNLDLDDLESRITDRTRAVSAVHLMGNTCDMDRLQALCQRHELVLIEDCCEALGAMWKGQPVGTFGVAASFSFFFAHHMTTMEGGLVGCADPGLSDVVRLLRAHGWSRDTKYATSRVAAGTDSRYTFQNLGFNVRPTEVSAAFGLTQLERFAKFEQARLDNVRYLQTLWGSIGDDIQLMTVHPDTHCAWFALPFTVLSNAPFSRDDLTNHLEEAGVETRPIVAGNLLRQPAAHLLGLDDGEERPGADRVHNAGFYVGLHPYDERKQLERFRDIVDEFVHLAR